MASLIIHGAHLISPGIEREGMEITINEGRIESVIESSGVASSAGSTFDASGLLVLPGFLDIHTHGAGGASMMHGTEEAVRTMALKKMQEGVTSFLPTTWTADHEELVDAMKGTAAYQKRQEFSQVPAVHIEGPFINPECLGAQNGAFVRSPDVEEIDELGRIAKIAVVSVATEMEGGLSFVKGMTERGIVTSLAHTGATYQQFQEAKVAGLTHLTHFCNQMTKLHHREIGIVGAGLLDDDIRLEMICDTIHLCPEMIALVFKHCPVERIMLITDSIAASWLEDGEYQEGGQPVFVKDGVCRLKSGALAGSTARYYECLWNVWQITGKPLSELIATTCWNQAQSIGLQGIGKIEPGFHADLALVDPETLEPKAAVIAGKLHEW